MSCIALLVTISLHNSQKKRVRIAEGACVTIADKSLSRIKRIYMVSNLNVIPINICRLGEV